MTWLLELLMYFGIYFRFYFQDLFQDQRGGSQVGVKHTKLLQQACFIYFIKEKEIKT